MSMPFQNKKQLLIGQLSIVIFSIVAGFLGRSGLYYWLFILLYFIIYMILMSKFSQPNLPHMVKAEKVETGKTLFEEDKAFEVASSDKQYVVEMQEQMKIMQSNMMFSFVVLIYFFFAIGPVTSYVAPKFADERIGFAVAYFILFEGSFLLSLLGQYYIGRRMSKAGKKVVAMNMPRAFAVTTEGIIIKGLTSSKGIKFPITLYKVVLDEERKFVELVHETDKVVNKIRLYTKNPNKLYDIISKRSSENESK